MAKPRYLTRLEQVHQLSASERKTLEPVTNRFNFRSNEYYQSLINWDDPFDPIRRIVMPDSFELYEWGELDASHEEVYTVAPGVEHKYTDTVLLLVNDVCGAYCRFCFRKRLFMNDNDEVEKDVNEGLAYIAAHPEISNVLLTGGDPLLLSNRRLREIIGSLREIDHVHIIRLGTKMPAFDPFRISEDSELLDIISRYSTARRKIYIMAHFSHPRELTPEARNCLFKLHRAGAVIVNQTPLIRGVNDDPVILAELFNRLSYIGVPPYYLFQCRPTAGNFTYSMPIEHSLDIFQEARRHCSGLAKRARLTMSHFTGKIEILAKDKHFVYLKYHRAANPELVGVFMQFRRNSNAYWFDDYEESSEYCNATMEYNAAVAGKSQ